MRIRMAYPAREADALGVPYDHRAEWGPWAAVGYVGWVLGKVGPVLGQAARLQGMLAPIFGQVKRRDTRC
jgi:hypothetical protein